MAAFTGGCQRGAVRYEAWTFSPPAQPWDHMNPDLPKFTKQPKV